MAHESMVLLLFLALGSVFPCFTVTKDEDLEREKALKILNKPPLKTIRMQNGDIFDCVDMYKQPSLDHPLLKNHIVQISPSIIPERDVYRPLVDDILIDAEDIAPKESCPPGTVLIRRMLKEDLIHAKLHSNPMNKSNPDHSVLSSENHVNHYAILETEPAKYWGSSAVFNVYGFPDLAPLHATAAQLWIAGGDQRNVVQAGWQVQHSVYGDSQTHFSAHWTADGYNKTGCTDILCPGFVQTSGNISLGIVLTPVSVYKGPQYGITVTIFKDPNTGHWWLTFGNNFREVGYWPKELFNNLDPGSVVEWGGFTSAPPSSDTDPPMGSGHFPSEGANRTGFVYGIGLVSDKTRLYKPDRDYVRLWSDANQCYRAENFHDDGGDVGYLFTYGGPGGPRAKCRPN